MKRKIHLLGMLGLIAAMFAQGAWAATCTSIRSANWGNSSTWNCGHVPTNTDTAVIANGYTVTLNNNYTVGILNINAGGIINDNANNLIVNGNITVNGTFGVVGGGGALVANAAGAVISGAGAFADSILQINNSATIASGSTMNFSAGGMIDVGPNAPPPNTVTLNIAGAVTGSGQTAGNTILNGNGFSSINITGSINAPASDITLIAGDVLTNNGSVSIQTLTTSGGATWTQGVNSSLTLGSTAGFLGTLNASANGNTVNFPAGVAPIPSTSKTYYNISGPTCAQLVGYTILGTGPACSGTTVTSAPSLCVNDTSIGVATGNWTGLNNVGTQNNVYAQASVANSDITNYLKCTSYGFTIPAGATITGITVGPWLNATWTMLDNAMQLVKGGVIQPTNLATGATIPNGGGALAATPTQFTYGGSTNLWSNTWTPADINSATFGAAFAAQRGGFASTQQAAVDAMPITIDYTLPTAPTVSSINLASTNPSSPATAVSWTVTFSASVSGVATGNFVLVQAGGVSGASITSVTGSGTTWIVTANTGSGTGSLGLNMANVTGISPAVTTTMPFVGQVYTISAPMTCITDNFSTGTLDPTLWSVKTILGPYLPQVINAGGGDYRLRLTDTQNNEATFAQLKRTFPAAGNKVVLEIDYFAYGGSGADGIAVTFSDATIASTTGGFGGSLGYAQNTTNPGFGGGWLGIGLDEYGNYPNPTESRNGYPAGWTAPAPANASAGFYKTNVAVRGSGSGTTGYYLLANTGVLATPVAPASGAAGATPYRYRFTLDHSDSVHAYVTVERDITGTGTSYTTLVPKFDVKATTSLQATVPANWLVSFTGSTGGSTDNHEIKQVTVCANAIVGGGPNHLEIQHASGTGLTCTPSTLTIKACTDAAVPCVTPYTSGVTGTLSSTGTPTVNWSGGSGFSIPSGGSTVTKDVQVTTPGSVVLGATSTPSASSATACNFGSPSCTFTAVDTGFLVSAPNHVAESSSTLTVQAVKKANNSLTCVPAFTTPKTVNLKCAYSNPATGTLPVRIGGTALNASANAASACDGTGANVSLSFNASGVATSALQYADVGQMNVSATYTGIAGSLDAGLSMIGTGSFIAAPASFSFSNLPAGPIKAGNAFSATISALNNAGTVTPNFGKESTPGPEGVTLTSTLVTPNPVTYPAAANPTPGNNVIAGTEFGAGGMVNDANGVATVNNLSWGEVGNISLLATLTNTYGYLGTAATPTRDALNNLLIATGSSVTVGAFIPDHFDTAVIATATTPMPCPTGLTCPAVYNGFVYSGQPFSEQVTAMYLLADGTTTGTTTNYHSAYGLSNNVTLTAWDALGSVVTQNPPGGTSALAINPMLSTAFNSGVGLTSTQAYTFASSPTTPTDIFLRAVDAVNTSVTSRRATPATSVEGGVKVVSGKVKISNAHGSELLPLPLTATVQYWNGTSWLTSTTDSLTQFNTNLSAAGGSIVAAIVTGLGSGISVATPGMVTVAGGVRTFTLNAPGVADSADISLKAPGYLLGGSNGAGINPSKAGRATFGVYKGASEFIYLRENY